MRAPLHAYLSPHISRHPNPISQVLKIKVGCTTAVLKLPGNNVKDQEVLLQGHCVAEVSARPTRAYQ